MLPIDAYSEPQPLHLYLIVWILWTSRACSRIFRFKDGNGSWHTEQVSQVIGYSIQKQIGWESSLAKDVSPLSLCSDSDCTWRDNLSRVALRVFIGRANQKERQGGMQAPLAAEPLARLLSPAYLSCPSLMSPLVAHERHSDGSYNGPAGPSTSPGHRRPLTDVAFWTWFIIPIKYQ